MHIHHVNFVVHLSNIYVDVFRHVYELFSCPIIIFIYYTIVGNVNHHLFQLKISNPIPIIRINKFIFHQHQRHQQRFSLRFKIKINQRFACSKPVNSRNNSLKSPKQIFSLIIVLIMMFQSHGWHVFDRTKTFSLFCLFSTHFIR